MFTVISGLFRSDIGDTLFDDLARIHPDGVCGNQNHAFRCMLPSDCLEVSKLLERLKQAGLRPSTRGVSRKEGEEFAVAVHRRYDYTDLRLCRFVECMPLDWLAHPKTDASDHIVANAREIKSGVSFMRYFAVEYRILVRDDVKRVLNSASLSNVLFKPVHINPVDGVDRAWWELTTSVIAPPLSPTLAITVRGKSAQRGETGYSWGFSEGIYAYPELRYLRSDIDALGETDLALTYEGCSGTKRMIVSQRLFETCAANDIEVNWLPVHVDEG